MWKSEPSVVFTIAFDDLPVGAFERRHLTEHEVDLSLADELHHLVDAVGRGAEFGAAMQQRQMARERREVERPVERRVAAAGDQQPLAAERLHLAHRVIDRLRLVGLDAGDRRALRLERAAAGRDHDDLASNTLPAFGRDAEQRIADLLDVLDHLVEMEGRIERLDLLHQRVGQALAGDLRDAGNVVDRLLGIELGALAADLVEDVDEMRLHVEQAELEHREQADRARADDQRVGLDDFGLGQHSRNTLRISLRNTVIVVYGRLSSG